VPPIKITSVDRHRILTPPLFFLFYYYCFAKTMAYSQYITMNVLEFTTGPYNVNQESTIQNTIICMGLIIVWITNCRHVKKILNLIDPIFSLLCFLLCLQIHSLLFFRQRRCLPCKCESTKVLIMPSESL